MVFGAYEALNSDKLVVIPIGVNYSKPDKFRSNVFYNVGEVIPVKDFMGDYEQNQAKTYNKFLQVLEPRMKELITHINDKQNDEAVCQVEELCKKDLIKAQGLNYKNLADDFTVLTQLTEKVNEAAKTKPDVLEEFKHLAKQYFKALEKNGLKDWLINPKQNQNVNQTFLILRCCVLLAGMPLYLAGLAGNYLPLAVTHFLTKKSIKNIEFYSSIAIGAGMFVFWINYILWFVIIYLFSPTIFLPLAVCITFALCGYFSLVYYPFMKKTLGIYRILKNKTLQDQLTKNREKLISLINKF